MNVLKSPLGTCMAIGMLIFVSTFFSCNINGPDPSNTPAPSSSAATSPTPAPSPSGTPAPSPSPSPSPESSYIPPGKAAVLSYLTGLSNGSIDGVISGQNCFHGSEITPEHHLNGYQTQIVDLYNATNKWVGIIGLDYEYQRVFKPAELSSANKILIDYWKKGGLVALTLSPQNPWIVDEADIVANPGNYTGEGSCNDVTNVGSLDDLLDTSKAVHTAWMRKLDRIAVALQELEDAGVVVLWRPMQEMNGSWFWWGMKSHPGDPLPYVRVYRHMRDYFTNTKGLDNLLWVYSPNQSHGVDNYSNWNRTVDWAYPGDAYVDIVAGTNYDDALVVNSNDYAAYVALGKPLGIAEYGTPAGAVLENGTLDTRLYAQRLKDEYPKIAYWVSWHNFPESYKLNWGILGNQYYTELMTDPFILTRDDVQDHFINGSPNSGKTYKIMPLGDSFTYGQIDSPVGDEATYGGYRNKLRSLLTDNGIKVDFVGSQAMGAFSDDNQNEGHSGWVSDHRKCTSHPSWMQPEWDHDLYSNIDGWLDLNVPDIVLLMIGINDTYSGFGISNIDCANSQKDIVDKILAKNPDAMVFIGKNNGYGFTDLNNALATIASNFQSSGKKVYLVDPHSGWNVSTMIKEGHPSKLGYDVMAENWYNAIKDYL